MQSGLGLRQHCDLGDQHLNQNIRISDEALQVHAKVQDTTCNQAGHEDHEESN
jgi:hypothetical protein